MDYKKAYKEALERARIFSKRWEGVEITDSELALKELKKIFPELKESEDEKIRKEMIEVLEKEAKEFPSSVIASKANSWIAWLEKQGENKPDDKVEPKFKVGDWITSDWKVTSIERLDYILQSQNGDTIDDTISHVDEHCGIHCHVHQLDIGIKEQSKTEGHQKNQKKHQKNQKGGEL